MGVSRGATPIWGWAQGGLLRVEKMLRAGGSWSSLTPSLQLSSTCPSAVPQFSLCSVSGPLGRGFLQGRARLGPQCSYR